MQAPRRSLGTMTDLLSNKALWREQAYVNGLWVSSASKDVFDVKNPANGEVIARVPNMTAAEAESVCLTASEVWKGSWKQSTAPQRARVLEKMASLMTEHADDLAKIITLEAGKPLAESKGEVLYAASFYKYFSEEARRTYGSIIPSNVKGRADLVFKQSVGPAALITPWNFPAAMITRKVGPAIAAGCTVVIKPSEETPQTALALCAIAEAAGLPAGVMNCVTVDRGNVVEVGNTLARSKYIRKLSFTGSTAVGKVLLRESASTVKRVSMELGGNAPFIVFDDADLEVAIRALLASKFRNAGQTCISSNRILVQSKVYDEFADLLASKVRSMKTGNGLDDGVVVGPLINQQGLSKVSRQVKDCVSKGASVICGGGEVKELNERGGSFFLPTVLRDINTGMLPFNEETFGPIAPLCRFTSEEEAINLANATPFGLAGYACTRDLGRAFRVAEGIETGMMGINEGAISSDSTPFGGVKESGLGREGSFLGIEEYLETKFVCMGGLS